MTVTAAPSTRTLVATRAAAFVLPLVVGAGVFWLAFEGGTYSLTSRNTAAIAVWWTIALAIGFSLWPLTRIPRVAFLAGGLLAALAVWTALSMLWASSDERAFNEFNRVMLYLGIFLLAVLATDRRTAARWADGLALAVVGVTVFALGSRCFPSLFGETAVAALLPWDETRLSYPLNYWNGVGIFLSIGAPLLLRAATASDRAWAQGLALAPLPALAATIYLTSSRTAVLTFVASLLVFAVCTSRRWIATGAIAFAGLGSAAALAVLLQRDTLVNGPLESDAALSQGRSAALLIFLVCVITGLAFAGLRLLGRRFGRRPHRAVGWALAGVVAVAALGGIVAADPVERFHAFKEVPQASDVAADDPIRSHLLSTSGNGRWQWWGSAVDQWRASPVVGDGAGSFEAWWAENSTTATFVRDAHSLYLETLGELGIVGLALLIAVLVTGMVAGVRRVLRIAPEERTVPAAFLAVFVSFAVAAGVDWMWELPAVTTLGVLALALLVGPATGPVPPAADETVGRPTGASAPARLAGVVALIALTPLVIGAQAIPLLAASNVKTSQDAVTDGDLVSAADHAVAARELQPWAASTHLQVALVAEEAGRLEDALGAATEATDRDPRDWRMWLVRARVETKLGDVQEARRSLARAESLNPRSALFAGA